MKTWIVLADAGQACILTTPGNPRLAEEHQRFSNQDELAAAHLREGHEAGSASHGSGHAAYQPKHTKKENAVAHFVGTVVDVLEKARAQGQLAKVVLVAPPHMLGLLREKMGGPLLKLVDQQHPKDLMHEPLKAIREHLATLMGEPPAAPGNNR